MSERAPVDVDGRVKAVSRKLGTTRAALSRRYDVSTTLTAPRWPATILRAVDDVAELRKTEGGPIIVPGSATPGRALADAGLVDRFHLLVFPLLLGARKRLFSDADKDTTKLNAVEHEVYSNGVHKLVFDVLR